VRFDEDSQKAEILIDLLKVLDINLCIIYLNSIQRVEDLGVFLQKHGIDALKIHGKMEKEERASVVKVFREGKKTRYLLASDLLARGIDVP
jgi:superfamily II DNA/RNA helicase